MATFELPGHERADAVVKGDVVWSPPASGFDTTPVGRYLSFLRTKHGLEFDDYRALHEWSTKEVSAFWASVWDFYGVVSHTPFEPGLRELRMPPGDWFVGARLNYAEFALSSGYTGTAIVEHSQTRGRSELNFADLRDAVQHLAGALTNAGIAKGDTVAVYTPAITEAVVIYLACASIGAVYSSCPLEFGADAVISRIQQIEPKILFTTGGYMHRGRVIDRLAEIERIRRAVPSIHTTVSIPYLQPPAPEVRDAIGWTEFIEAGTEPLPFAEVAFDHPLTVVYTSGTTGPPKAIVHSHGGVLVEHLKSIGLQLGVDVGDRFFWYTTVGWMMWNYLISGLLVGATIVLFDGDPGYPDSGELWRLAADEAITVFGVSPRFLQLTRRSLGVSFAGVDLAALRTVGSTGSPLGVEEYNWFYREAGLNIPLVSASGGTDVLSAFVCWAPIVPVYAGEISCAALGVDVAVLNEEGEPVIDEEGELVIRQPMPSMPIRFWNDLDGQRLHQAYFTENPGVWTQGDWATQTGAGTFVLTGRSDATLNRRGIRMGTAELYAAVEDLPEVLDSLAVCTEATADHDDQLIILVVADPACEKTAVQRRVRSAIRERLSPRHVPDRVCCVSAIPRTSSGKKAELPVKRLLQGRLGTNPAEEAAVFRQSATAISEDLLVELRSLREGLERGGE